MSAPIKKFSSSGGLQVCVWKQVATKNGKAMEFSTVTLTRVYKDKNEEWQKTESLKEQDIPKVRALLQKAYEFIVIKNTELEGEHGGM